jgi:hypothetical protein
MQVIKLMKNITTERIPKTLARESRCCLLENENLDVAEPGDPKAANKPTQNEEDYGGHLSIRVIWLLVDVDDVLNVRVAETW